MLTGRMELFSSRRPSWLLLPCAPGLHEENVPNLQPCAAPPPRSTQPGAAMSAQDERRFSALRSPSCRTCTGGPIPSGCALGPFLRRRAAIRTASTAHRIGAQPRGLSRPLKITGHEPITAISNANERSGSSERVSLVPGKLLRHRTRTCFYASDPRPCRSPWFCEVGGT